MRVARSKRFRRPVISRLTLAWTTFVCVGVVFGGYSLVKGDEAKRNKIALPVEGEVELIARPLAAAEEGARPTLRGATGVTLASATPVLNSSSEVQSVTQATDDADVYADLPTLVSVTPEDVYDEAYDGEPISDEVVITINGAPARKPGERLALATPINIEHPLGVIVARPAAALLKKTAHGQIPKIASNGRRASRTYAKPFEAPKDKPQIAIVVGGLGLNSALTERAIDDLPATVTLAFAPYTKNLEFWVEKARKDGHEIVLELPMEAHSGTAEALGPAALLTNRTPAENLERLDWMMARFKGYFAATNYLGGKFSADPQSIRPILDKLREAGVAYIDDTGAIRRAGAKGEWTIVNRMITPGQSGIDASAVKQDLLALEKIAKRDGDALGKTFAYEVSIDEIKNWADGLSKRGFVIAPASAVLHARGPAF